MKLYKAIEKSFPKIEKLFTKEKLLEFLETSLYNIEKYNFGLGSMIRLKLLSSRSKLYRMFVQNGFTDRDVMTMEIIKKFYHSIR